MHEMRWRWQRSGTAPRPVCSPCASRPSPPAWGSWPSRAWPRSGSCACGQGPRARPSQACPPQSHTRLRRTIACAPIVRGAHAPCAPQLAPDSPQRQRQRPPAPPIRLTVAPPPRRRPCCASSPGCCASQCRGLASRWPRRRASQAAPPPQRPPAEPPQLWATHLGRQRLYCDAGLLPAAPGAAKRRDRCQAWAGGHQLATGELSVGCQLAESVGCCPPSRSPAACGSPRGVSSGPAPSSATASALAA
jgi:hypothetical protein